MSTMKMKDDVLGAIDEARRLFIDFHAHGGCTKEEQSKVTALLNEAKLMARKALGHYKVPVRKAFANPKPTPSGPSNPKPTTPPDEK